MPGSPRTTSCRSRSWRTPGGSLLIRPYGVWVPVIGIASRVTFIIDKAGTIRDIVRKVDTAGHDRQVLASLEKLK